MTNENKVHHNIASDPFRHNYILEIETILQILRDCPLVKTVWKSLLSPNNVTPFFSPELLSTGNNLWSCGMEHLEMA
ncbi:hypothetical protein NC652_035640 [Populus alba x Populus x berolinensis]|nr:hypothetical protein NC652_035640 [Populus alba x Populus x berolinensis]